MALEGKEEYVDQTWPEWGVHYHWMNARVLDRMETAKGTLLEMVHRPQWGIACYMNGEIQSSEVDERIYHEALVHPAMVHVFQPRRVLILGGGEGATAREVLKWSSVERVDMYEWDGEVIECFRSKYRQWANGAWDDQRLVVHEEDVFSVFQAGHYPDEPYDVILIDLFEPESDSRMWTLFSRLASDWLSELGAISMYAGIRNHITDIHPAEVWLHPDRIQEQRRQGIYINGILTHRNIFSYKMFIPSFLGESMFLLLTHNNSRSRWDTLTSHVPDLPLSLIPLDPVSAPVSAPVSDPISDPISDPVFAPALDPPLVSIRSHLTAEVWLAYHTWNRYPVVDLRTVRAVEGLGAIEQMEDIDAEGVFHGV